MTNPTRSGGDGLGMKSPCCNSHMFVSDGGNLTCSLIGCKNPDVMGEFKNLAAKAALAERMAETMRWGCYCKCSAVMKCAVCVVLDEHAKLAAHEAQGKGEGL